MSSNQSSTVELQAQARPMQAQVTLRTYALAAIAAQLGLNEAAAEPELQFLHRYQQAIDPDGGGWMRSLPDYLRQPAPPDLPLIRVARHLKLTVVETLALAIAVAVEEDVMVGRALARIQAPLGGSRPTLSLLATALANATGRSVNPIHCLANGIAVHSGLLQRLHLDAPLPEQALQVPLHLYFALSNQDGHLPGMTLGQPEAPVPLPPSVLSQVKHHANGLQKGRLKVLAIRTGSLSEGQSVATAIAQQLGCRPLWIEAETLSGVAPWLFLRRLLPVFEVELAPGDRKVLPEIPFYDGPVLVLANPDGSLESAQGDVLSWVLPIPCQAERQQLWQIALGNPDLAANLARHHRHGSGRIAQLGRLAHHYSLLQEHPQPTQADVAIAAWSGEGLGLDALAQPLADRVVDDALVLPPDLRVELDHLLLRCRARDGLVEGLGASAITRYHPGVRALFVGPSGTGKTLAASWLATQLGMPLYRVDLAAVISKYIGETEKNLAQLLARAEQAEVILLFDEADSLFGKRTEVQHANDRFANTQTNYLLQRIESYDGITLLTSNSRNRFDSAFSRRLDFVIEFPLPRPQERRALWQSHLGGHHTVTPEALNQLAALSDLCGGHIRNVVLAAAVQAHIDDRPIAYPDLLQGLMLEYHKLSRPVPNALKQTLSS